MRARIEKVWQEGDTEQTRIISVAELKGIIGAYAYREARMRLHAGEYKHVATVKKHGVRYDYYISVEGR